MSARHVLTILAVESLARAAVFYRDAFGWLVTVETPVYVEFLLPGDMRLGVYERKAFSKNVGRLPLPVERGDLTGTELYLQVEDLDDACRRAVNAGAALLSPAARRPWGDRVAYLRDTDGNVVALADIEPAETGSSRTQDKQLQG